MHAHRIASNLWMGDHHAASIRGCAPFDLVVLAAREYQPLLPCKTAHAPLYDSKPSLQEVQTALRAAREVNAARAAGREVLVSCWMGLNRSGLIVALALILDGMTAEQAIATIRQARKTAIQPLNNQHFVGLLRRLGPKLIGSSNAQRKKPGVGLTVT